MKTSKGKRTKANAPSAAGGRCRDRRLVVLDQEPLRRKAAAECKREMTRLAKLTEDWKRFETEDRPGFERWVAATFGALLTEIREKAALIQEKEMLVDEVYLEISFGRSRSYRTAYAAVMKRRAAPPEPPPEWRSDSSPPPPPGEEDPFFEDFEDFERAHAMPEEEKRALFEEYLWEMMGLNPRSIGAARYDKMFAEFRASFFDEPPPPPQRPGHAAAEPPKTSRLKELYRILVRRLHPDTLADKSASVTAIWHDVQEAYAAGDVDRLEMLLALTEIKSDEAGSHTTLFQMRSVAEELRRSIRALQRSLGQAKKNPAWDFARSHDRSALRKRMGRELESQAEHHRRVLAELEHMLAQWATPPKPRKPRKKKAPPRRTTRRADHF